MGSACRRSSLAYRFCRCDFFELFENFTRLRHSGKAPFAGQLRARLSELIGQLFDGRNRPTEIVFRYNTRSAAASRRNFHWVRRRGIHQLFEPRLPLSGIVH